MPVSSRVPIPNALMLISDLGGGTAPDLMRDSLIASTSTCIAVGCMADGNGETEITLGAAQDVGLSQGPAFEGELETPSHAIGVWTVLRKTILQVAVPRSSTKVRIWVNHSSEPDKVVIGLD